MPGALHPPVLGALVLMLAATNAGAQTIQMSPSDLLRAPASAGASVLPRVPAAPAAAMPEPAGPVAQGYLYVEPYQARFEYLMDAPRLLRWLNPGEEPPEQLTPAAQKDAVRALDRQVESWCKLSVGSSKVQGGLTSVAVVMGRPGDTRPLEEGETVPVAEAMFGFMWEFATPPLPEDVLVDWSGFISDIRRLPVRVFFGNNSEAMEVQSYLPKLAWKSEGRVPPPMPLAPMPEITVVPPVRVPLATILWVSGAVAFVIFLKSRGRPMPGGAMPWMATIVLGAALTWPLVNVRVGGGAEVPEIREAEQAAEILTPLLRNVYRAFDRRDEEHIYDVLARSVDGPLLRRLYLETIEALTLDGREGSRVTISEFSVEVREVMPGVEGGGFEAECQWTALGKVGHWGHMHTRVNRYSAKVRVSPVGSDWKLTDLTVTEARRI